METTELAPGFSICRVLNGMWQVSGGHGRIEPDAAVQEMLRYHDAGFTTWDLADHYGPAEDFIGAFRRRLANERGVEALAAVQLSTLKNDAAVADAVPGCLVLLEAAGL